MLAKEIEKNIAIQQYEQEQYGLTKMCFKDGRTMFGHFLGSDQSQSLKSQNKWVFYFDEIRLILHGDEIAQFDNIYYGVEKAAIYA